MPKKDFDEFISNRKLESTVIFIKTYSGERMLPFRFTNVYVKYNNKKDKVVIVTVTQNNILLTHIQIKCNTLGIFHITVTS